MGDPSHAIAALRQLNNNPKIFGPNRRPIVEFSVENVKVCGGALCQGGEWERECPKLE